jgi:hypothetical protein
MLSQPQLETKRLSLRPLTFADASWIQKVASVRQIADTMISIPHPYPDGEAERYISKQILSLKEVVLSRLRSSRIQRNCLAALSRFETLSENILRLR